MQNGYTVDILTPNKVVVAQMPASSLIIPTVRGQINVLENHTHIVTKLETGMLSVFGGADDPDRHFAISSGVCKVLDGKVQILAHVAEESHEIDKERAERALQNAQDVLANRDDLNDEEISKYRNKVERAKLRIQLSEYTGNPNL